MEVPEQCKSMILVQTKDPMTDAAVELNPEIVQDHECLKANHELQFAAHCLTSRQEWTQDG